MKLLNLALIFLTAISVLSSCAGFPKYPEKHLYRPLLKHGVCLEFVIVDVKSLVFDCVKDEQNKCVQHPLSVCDGIFGYKNEDIPDMINWGQDVMDYGKNHCKAK